MEQQLLKWPGYMSTAEIRAYQQICDKQGKMFIVAIDQRNAMRELLSDNEDDRSKISDLDLGGVKSDVVRYLGNHAPAVLLDPECALPKVVNEGILARDVALIIGMDASGWEMESVSSLRRSQLIPGMSASQVRRLGGTAAKLLVYMRPDLEGKNGYSAKLINQLTTSCSNEDVLLVVEILIYSLPNESPEDYESKKPELILEAAKIAAENGAKVLKLQYPGSSNACAEITKSLNGIPWALLSAGVDHEVFLDQLETALSNGASGAIVGRALWKDCISLDPKYRAKRLTNLAVPRLRKVYEILDGNH